MKLYLQFGYGMMDHTLKLLSEWGTGGVILSPRDLNARQLQRMAESVLEMSCEPLLDPQCFAHDSDHERLLSHEYFKRYRENPTDSFQGGIGTAQLLGALSTFARGIGIRRHILPSPLASPVNDDWFSFQENIINEAPTHFGDEPLLATISISNESMLDENQVEAVIEQASSWNVQGFYIVAESDSAYLVENPIWVANVLILASGLKLLNKEVIVGYANHQLLPLAAANVDIIASGTWLNVRAFPIEKFYERDPDEKSRRAIWYYCPQGFSEYKIPFLDVARRLNILSEMRPEPSLGSEYANPLFSGAAPSSVNWSQTTAFRHYLTCLKSQVSIAQKQTYDETLASYRSQLNAAQLLLQRLRSRGVAGQDRDFSEIVEVNRSALILFDEARGERLRRG